MKQHIETDPTRKQNEDPQSRKQTEQAQMKTEQSLKDKQARKDKEKETGIRQPDPETLHTTDPQEHMKGPVSSFMQKVKDKAEKNNDQDKIDPELQSEEHTRKHGDKTN